jgi:glyoxylase-like metal-dependent hydrolase (beta-lactamase superfamily II)
MSMIHSISLGAVNAYLLKGEKYILIDTGAKGSHTKIVNELDKLGVKPSDINLIIITHGHIDHCGAVNQLAKVTGAKVLIHELEQHKMLDGHNGKLVPTGLFTKIVMNLLCWLHLDKGEKRTVYNGKDIIIDKDIDLREYGFDGKVVMTPGHTEGSISIITGENEAIIGDMLMPNLFTGRPGKPFFAYDLVTVKKSIQKMIDMGATTFYLSHGKMYSLDDIKIALLRF